MMNPARQSEQKDILTEIVDELTGILGFAELIQSDSERHDEYAAEVLHSAERGLELLRALSTKLLQPVPRVRCRVNEVVLDLEPSLRRVVGRGMPLEVCISPNFDTVPLGRRDLEALLLYLVAAARDANGQSAPIRVRTARVKGPDGSRRARITIEDQAGPPRVGDMRWFLLGEGPTDLLNALTPFVDRVREVGGSVKLQSETGDLRTMVSVELPTDDAPVAIEGGTSMPSLSGVAKRR